MSERAKEPSLDVYMPVLNIGAEQAADLKQQLIDSSAAPIKSDNLRKLLQPATAPRIYLAHHVEISRLAAIAGYEELDEEHVDELETHLYRLMPDSWLNWAFTAPTLPSKVSRIQGEGGGGLVLGVAASPHTQHARQLMKNILQGFYEINSVPKHTWFANRRATSPWLARSYGGTGDGLLRLLNVGLQEQPAAVLPKVTEIGSVKIEAYPRNANQQD